MEASYAFAANLSSWKLLMYLQEVLLRGTSYVFAGYLSSWTFLMYLRELVLRGSFLCICRKSFFVEASHVFAGNLPLW